MNLNLGVVRETVSAFTKEQDQAIPAGFPFFSLRAQRKRTKRKGSQATETTPVTKARNRRGKNSLRSDSLPLHPLPDLADRLSGNGPL